MIRWAIGSILMTFATLSVCAPGNAAEIEHNTDYSIALSGIPLARASFNTLMSDKTYSISGKLSSAGLADILSHTQGSTTVSGVVGRNKLQATHYSVKYQSGKKGRSIDVRYRNGNVTSSTLEPARAEPVNWVPVSGADKRGVLDPISGLIFPATAKVCPQTLPIFDGESRLDLKLSHKGTKPFKTKGFAGDAIVCGIKFVPKSGYRKGRDDVDYLRKLDTMEIWFAKADAVNVYAPVYVRIPTKLGPVTISATRFGG